MRVALLSLLALLLGVSPAAAHHAVAHDILLTGAPRIMLSASTPGTAEVHLALRNRSRHEHALIAAESPVAEDARLVGETPSVASGSTRPAGPDGIPVPARGTLHLGPGGPHILLTGVSSALRPGELVAVTLRFQDQSVLKLTAEVREN
ncbi:MAG: copper chaperone PCu(A)C [Thioalkalivibrio sp.]|nr:MAG: copper chaperone PCu(A)C [Thioalkalivibrio sp.]